MHRPLLGTMTTRTRHKSKFDMKVTLNKTQYQAINDLRGLPPEAHMLVMCARSTEKGGVLDGRKAAFEELVSHIGEELADGMVSEAACRALFSAAVKIDPDCADWLGM